ncbi:hypothetical protein FQR65_LT16655 [Abscondita terminalis]|nr:hypothetical protein FQR65_LT16655 [Abscondita terminalis]
MIKHFLCSLGISLGSLLTVHAQSQASFFSYPTLSPDGQTIVFSYDGDLWKVAADGGLALRLTAMSGTEIAPRISPDGKWLAFSSNQNGNIGLYTFDAAGDAFLRTVIQSIPGKVICIYAKRYKGAFNPDILSYSPKQKQFKQYTDYAGKDFWPSVDQKGAIYFASDEANGEYNLYSFVNGKKTGLTKFPTSIKRPAVSGKTGSKSSSTPGHKVTSTVDETPIKVLDSDKKGAAHTGYYWVYHAPLDGTVLFDYSPTRGGIAAVPMLGNFKGYLQTDGYTVYQKYGKRKEVTHLACWAHARREFEKALDNDRPRAEKGLLMIQQYNAIERQQTG